MESKEYFEKVMQDYNQNRRGVACVSIAKMKQSIMTGSSSTRRTILYRRNSRNHRKMLSYKLSQLLDKLIERFCGEEVDASFLPCDYVRHFEDGTVNHQYSVRWGK